MNNDVGETAANGATKSQPQPVSTPAAGANTAASAVTHVPPIRPISWATACAVRLVAALPYLLVGSTCFWLLLPRHQTASLFAVSPPPLRSAVTTLPATLLQPLRRWSSTSKRTLEKRPHPAPRATHGQGPRYHVMPRHTLSPRCVHHILCYCALVIISKKGFGRCRFLAKIHKSSNLQKFFPSPLVMRDSPLV